ncbi:MAG: chemotaxis protein CheW [Bdellovibrionales bacterium]|nr:chemotaxis protein CheW [Bdellovibrionales bacterium]
MSKAKLKNNMPTSQVLTFKLSDELYAFDIHRVKEVLEFKNVTPVPKSHNSMVGVINLRGHVVPVIDLKLKCGLPETIVTEETCVIISEVKKGQDIIVMGALADSVEEVLEYETHKLEALPKIGARLNPEYSKGMARYDNEHFFILLNVDKILKDPSYLEVNTEAEAS